MEIGASPTQIFGSPTIDSVFSANVTPPPTAEQETARITVTAQKREINRIRGYKLQLTPADNKKLAEIQTEIQEIEAKASNGTVREDELEDRLDLFKEADEIIGKPIANVAEDEAVSDELARLAGILEALLEPNLSPSIEKRVEQLERVKETIEEQFNANPESATLRAQFQNLTAQIDALTPPRAISQLSLAEKKAYDDLTDLINDQAGVEIQLKSRDAIRVAELETSIVNLQGLLPPDISGQPTSQDVARAYARIG